LGFDGSGINITSFPYFFGFIDGDYHMIGNAASDNTGLAYGLSILYTITPISAIPSPTSPIASLLSFYSMTMYSASSATIMNAFFSTNASNTLQHFYDTSNSTVDILSTGSWDSPDYLYQAGWGSFDSNGINLTSFPYYSNVSTGDWHITGTGDANTAGFVSAQSGGVLPMHLAPALAPASKLVTPIMASSATPPVKGALHAKAALPVKGARPTKPTPPVRPARPTKPTPPAKAALLAKAALAPPAKAALALHAKPTPPAKAALHAKAGTIAKHVSHAKIAPPKQTPFTPHVNAMHVPFASLSPTTPTTFMFAPITTMPAPTGPITPYSPPPPPSGVVCFKEGSKILTDKGYKPIQELRKGDLVQTSKNGYKAIFMIGKRDMEHIGMEERIKDQLYSCKQEQYPELLEELVITGCHSILVSDFKEGERERSRDINGRIFVTDNKYRLPACVDMRASVYDKKGVHTIYHIALENDDYYMNYGVYANGLLVETCSKRYLKELSHMELF